MIQRKKLKGLQGKKRKKKEKTREKQEPFWGLVRQDGERKTRSGIGFKITEQVASLGVGGEIQDSRSMRREEGGCGPSEDKTGKQC